MSMPVIASPGFATQKGDGRMQDTAQRVVQMQGVTKTYGAFRAVNGIDVEIHRGEVVALLGPNGAGKSTTIGMLLGLLTPTAGTVQVYGMSPVEAIRQSRVGAMLQEGKLVAGVQVGEFLDFVRSLHPHPLPKDDLMELTGLSGLEHRRIERLSGGETQRVRFAMAIAGNPDFLVLDEPTAAMDVEARRDFWVRMHAYAALGHTILFATHYLEEAETFASRLLFIAHGQIIADGTVQQIRERFGEPQVSFTWLAPAAEMGTPDFERLPGVHKCEVQGERVTLHTKDADATVRALVGGTYPWKDLEVKSANLDEVFVTLVHEGDR